MSSTASRRCNDAAFVIINVTNAQPLQQQQQKQLHHARHAPRGYSWLTDEAATTWIIVKRPRWVVGRWSVGWCLFAVARRYRCPSTRTSCSAEIRPRRVGLPDCQPTHDPSSPPTSARSDQVGLNTRVEARTAQEVRY